MGRGRGGGRRHSGSCSSRFPCSNCYARIQQASNEDSGWTPRTVGTTEDDRTVTFRQGVGENEDHTLIADGIPSGRAFDRRGEHNHYGPNREDEGWVEEDRGYYTGPGA